MPQTPKTESESLTGGSNSPKVWPRTAEGWCSCPYCTGIRDGTLPKVEAPRKRDWLERVGGRGQSVSAQMVEEGYRDVGLE